MEPVNNDGAAQKHGDAVLFNCTQEDVDEGRARLVPMQTWKLTMPMRDREDIFKLWEFCRCEQCRKNRDEWDITPTMEYLWILKDGWKDTVIARQLEHYSRVTHSHRLARRPVPTFVPMFPGMNTLGTGPGPPQEDEDQRKPPITMLDCSSIVGMLTVLFAIYLMLGGWKTLFLKGGI